MKIGKDHIVVFVVRGKNGCSSIFRIQRRPRQGNRLAVDFPLKHAESLGKFVVAGSISISVNILPGLANISSGVLHVGALGNPRITL